MPRPRKLSSRLAENRGLARRNVACTTSGPEMLGSTCRSTIFGKRSPTIREAWM